MSDLLSRSLDDLIAARAAKPKPRADGGDRPERTGGPKAERSGPKAQKPASAGQQVRVVKVRAAEQSERRGRQARQDVSAARACESRGGR